MASPMNSSWWSTFLTTHGADSEEQSAFEGYLYTKGIDAGSDPDVLEAAYAEFHAWMLESGSRGADPGPTRAELVSQQAVETVEALGEHVPKSRSANPGMNKPLTDATHPQAREVATAPPAAAPSGETPSAVPEPRGETVVAPDAVSHRGGRGRGE
jgi:hypothetical protein